MRDRDKLRRVKRANEVQAETLDEYRNTIKFLELKVLRLETEIEQAKEMEEAQRKNDFKAGNECACMCHENIEDYFNQYIKSE